MKLFKKYALPIVIIGLIIFLIVISQSKKQGTEKLVKNTNSTNKCFLYQQAVPDSELVNTEYIELVFEEGNRVSGNHAILPVEKKPNHATLVGVTDGTFVNVIASARAEGENWQEQRVYKFINNDLYVGYQPVFVPRYKNKYGVYMYEDINKLVFDTEEFFLKQVDCDSVDRKTLI